MDDHAGPAPTWSAKFAEGKMFRRIACDRCGARFHFGETPRATRVPRCPACGSLATHLGAA